MMLNDITTSRGLWIALLGTYMMTDNEIVVLGKYNDIFSHLCSINKFSIDIN